MAARTLCVGFDGTQASSQVLAALGALRPAGVILFARNIVDVESCRALVERVREACEDDVPLLVAVDQEGGRVTRLRRGAVEIPSAMALAACDDDALCERAGLALARDVRRAGANLNFAPVLDVASDPRNTVIGARSFGDDAARVARLGLAVARGLERGGVAATAKHFPGHGATAVDSHVALPIVQGDLAQLRARDLAPFGRAAQSGIRAIMTAHVAIPALEPNGRPATLSKRLLTDVLRGELGFQGVCVTDCLEMGAITSTYGSEGAAVEALRAGADLLVVSHTLSLAERIATAIAAAVDEGTLARARLEEAVGRVDALRAWLRAQPPLPAEDSGVGREAARRSLMMLRGELPRWTRGSRALIVSFELALAESCVAASADAVPALDEPLRALGIEASTMRLGVAPSDDEVLRAREAIAAARDAHVALIVRRAQHTPAQLAAASALLEAAPDALLVVAREPYDAVLIPQARRVLCTFGDEAVSLEAVADALAGDRRPLEGRMPVTLSVGG